MGMSQDVQRHKFQDFTHSGYLHFWYVMPIIKLLLEVADAATSQLKITNFTTKQYVCSLCLQPKRKAFKEKIKKKLIRKIQILRGGLLHPWK
jgi:hypothetical protein